MSCCSNNNAPKQVRSNCTLIKSVVTDEELYAPLDCANGEHPIRYDARSERFYALVSIEDKMKVILLDSSPIFQVCSGESGSGLE